MSGTRTSRNLLNAGMFILYNRAMIEMNFARNGDTRTDLHLALQNPRFPRSCFLT